jgi:hypothetical protein
VRKASTPAYGTASGTTRQQERDKRAGGGELFIPKGFVITTLATEAWLVVFVLVVGAKAALSWLV